MIVAVPNTTSTEVLAALGGADKKHAVWFQNYDTTNVVNLNCGAAADDEEFCLPPAESATKPSSLVIQSSGGDGTLVNASWRAYQASGASLDLYCGRW
jgi:hypothetical protein